MTPQDEDRRPNTPTLHGRGRGWGLSANALAELHARAADMRGNPSEPEKRLWRLLSGSKLAGRKFRRQAVVAPFIADFLCPQEALIVEVDGDTHDVEKDRLRDDALAASGYRTMRVTNADILTNMDGMAAAIVRMIARPEVAATPHPNPSPEVEGLEG
ncbi:Very-short-patch-repair endonuclease [Sphingomonas gellani]|uniref:Very-short-patch-repair endonuclease n=1 Tax=Sphingomonas gellani TaxID=1166340 RepID=A0A1H8FVB8_9SPHN|nr:endonuclease domain-containing protein [Sphingomonas gellani]SEN35038.1 Very-short-patch-repair endonuclease [Sphingomonas gellani]